MYGGMTGAVSEYLAAHCPAPLETVSIRDTFGESGEPEELLTKYGLMPPDIIAAAKRAIARKKGK